MRMTEAQTEIVDPDAPNKFLRVYTEEEELAMIPWETAKAIAEAVNKEDQPRTNARVINSDE